MKQILLALALVLCGALRGQSLFDSSQVHEVRIFSLYDGLVDTLTSDYILSFDFFQQQIRDIPYTYCKIELDGAPLDTIGIRQKGFNSWWSSPKKPMKLDLNRFVDDQQYEGLKKLNLHNRAGDPTFLRENLCYELLRKMGVPAPRTSFARVYIDDGYAGVYRLVEEVDNAYLDRHFGDHKGNLYKQNSSGSAGYTLDWLGNKPENYYPQYDLENHRDQNDWSPLIRFVDVLNNTPDAAFADSIATVFDVPGFLRVLALDYAVNNLDFYANSGRNYFLYHDAGGDGKIHWLPWDYNLTWREDAPPVEPDWAVAPVLVRRLLGVPAFRQIFREQYCVLRQYFDAAVLRPRMEADSALIRPWLDTDPSGDFAPSDFEQNIGADWFHLPGLKPNLDQRSTRIDQFLQDHQIDCALVLPTTDPVGASGFLHIFPNPVLETITLQWPDVLAARPGRLQVHDASSGRLLRDEPLPAGSTSFLLDLSNLPPGMYIVQHTGSGARVVGKVVKIDR